MSCMLYAMCHICAMCHVCYLLYVLWSQSLQMVSTGMCAVWELMTAHQQMKNQYVMVRCCIAVWDVLVGKSGCHPPLFARLGMISVVSFFRRREPLVFRTTRGISGGCLTHRVVAYNTNYAWLVTLPLHGRWVGVL